jgi:hypothetical protein
LREGCDRAGDNKCQGESKRAGDSHGLVRGP